MLNPRQIKVVQIAKRKLKLDDEDYRAILERTGGVSSCKDLDYLGFDSVMREFERLGFKSTWKEKNLGDRPGMASPRQVWFIRKLWQDYSGEIDESDAHLNRWLHKYHHVSAVRMISEEKAGKIIPALKQMIKRPKEDARP